jgi:hypothetical protein
MVKRWIKCPSLIGLAASSTAVCNLPIGPRYHTLEVSGTGTSATTHINEMRLKVNGKVQRVMTYTELQALNILNGSQYGVQGTTTFILPIFLAEPWRKSNRDQDALAWGTGNLDSFQLEIDITSSAPTTLQVIAQIDNSIVQQDGKNVQQPMGLIVKWDRVQLPLTGTTPDYGTASFPIRDNYQSIHITDAGGTFTSYALKVDNFVIREVTKSENDAILTHYGMTPVSGRLDIVFDHDDFLNSALPTQGPDGRRIQDLKLSLVSNTATARNLPTIYQRIGLPE